MYKHLIRATLGLIVIMVVLSLGAVNAVIVTHYTGSNIEYRLNDNTEHFTGVGTITIRYQFNSKMITILDRNLGATAAGTGCDENINGGYCAYHDTYGYHFQRGNNYGFKPGCDLQGSTYKCTDSITSGALEGQVDANTIEYNPSNQQYYTSGVFYKGNDNRLNDDNKDDLWGGSIYDEFNQDKMVSNPTERQGPCPKGFHVPSVGEINELRKMMGYSASDMRTKLLVPLAGERSDYDASVAFLGSFAGRWTSSPEMDEDESFYFNPDIDDSWNFNERAAGLSIRCFYNFYKPYVQSFTLSFTGSEGGSISTGSIEADEGSSISRDDEVSSITISGTVVATGIADEGYVFSGWLTDCVSDTVTTGCSFTGVFKFITYEITYELDGGTNNPNNVTGYTIETPTITLENPTKDGYTFDGWFLDTGFTTQITGITRRSTGNIILYAKWTKIETKPSGGYSGGGSRSSSKDVISNDSEKSSEQPAGNQVDSSADKSASEGQDNTQDSQQSEQASANASEGQNQQQFTQEFQEAYEFAKGKGITTMPTIQKADMDGKLTRIAMAKMLSQYAMNVLGQKPANIVTPKFKDVTDKENSDYDDGVTLAYQLGIMGQNMPDNKFRPNDEVTRAEFATALSRMIYNTSDGEFKSTPKYYIHHMEKLVKEGTITNDDPNMKELRGYVMIMLMRSAGK